MFVFGILNVIWGKEKNCSFLFLYILFSFSRDIHFGLLKGKENRIPFVFFFFFLITLRFAMFFLLKNFVLFPRTTVAKKEKKEEINTWERK